MFVYRIEHTDCPVEPHGPANVLCYDSMSYPVVPTFGTWGSLPYSIEKGEVCAVTKEQFPHWWSRNSLHPDATPIKYVPAGWTFQRYEVPDHLVRFDNNQVLFRPENAIGNSVTVTESEILNERELEYN